MAYWPYQGATLLIAYNDVPHLFVVVNDPCKNGLCVLAMVSSVKPNRPYDNACVLRLGDHKFIDHDSYVVYRIAYQARADHISGMVEKGYYKPKDDLSVAVYTRLLSGFIASDEATPSMVTYLKSLKLI